MNQAENQAENSELLNQESNKAVSDEKPESIDAKSDSTDEQTNQSEKQGDEKPIVSAEDKSDAESEDESEDGSFEWTQKRSVTNQSASPTDNGDGTEAKKPDASTEALQKRISELEAMISEKENLLIQIQGVSEDPIIRSWAAHKERHGNEASPSLFLQEMGQIKFVDSRSDEEKLKEYFTDLAKQAGVKDDDMETAIQEDLDAFYSKTIRERQSLLKDAEKHLSKLEVRSVEDLEKQYKDQTQAIMQDGIQWVKTNYQLAEDFINKVVSKGVFNGKRIDRKWGEKILEAFRESRAVLDPRYIVLADPDDKGQQLMYIPEMVEVLDSIEFRKENMEFYKSQIKRSRAENLGERAEKAEQGRISKELQKETTGSKYDREWLEANKSFGIKVGS